MRSKRKIPFKFLPYLFGLIVFLALCIYLTFFHYGRAVSRPEDHVLTPKRPIFIGTSVILLPEYNIHMRISDNLKDLVYYVERFENGDTTLYFSTETLNKMDESCRAAQGAIGTISNMPTYWDKKGSYTQAIQLGSRFYLWTREQRPCASPKNQDANRLQEVLSDSLEKAFQTVQLGQ